jgi:hypothetical protein
MPGRPYELDSEALGIIIGSENIDDFDIASIARAGICVIHPKRLAERLFTKAF